MKRVLVCGGGGFLGLHLVRRLKAQEEVFIRCVDLKKPLYSKSEADEFKVGDLTDDKFCKKNFHYKRSGFDEIYQFASHSGNSKYNSDENNNNSLLVNNFKINNNACVFTKEYGSGEILFASSNAVYAQHNQMNEHLVVTKEDSYIPANPVNMLGWSNILCEKLYQSSDIYSKIIRYGNVFGLEDNLDEPNCGIIPTLCKQIVNCNHGDKVKIIGNGNQTRNFLHIDDCIDATLIVSAAEISEPINIGSETHISINELCNQIASLVGRQVIKEHIDGNVGCAFARCDSSHMRQRLKWTEQSDFTSALQQTIHWIKEQGGVKVSTGR